MARFRGHNPTGPHCERCEDQQRTYVTSTRIAAGALFRADAQAARRSYPARRPRTSWRAGHLFLGKIRNTRSQKHLPGCDGNDVSTCGGNTKTGPLWTRFQSMEHNTIAGRTLAFGCPKSKRLFLVVGALTTGFDLAFFDAFGVFGGSAGGQSL